MRAHRTAVSAPPDPSERPPAMWARALTAAACLAVLGGALVACAANGRTAAGAASTTGPTVSARLTPATSEPATAPPATAPQTSRAPSSTVTPASTVSRTVPPPPNSASGTIQALYDAWTAGDRAAAAKVAEPAAVDALFARTWTEAAGWTFARCEGAAGSVFCVWQRPGEELWMKARNTGGDALVNDVQFRASA